METIMYPIMYPFMRMYDYFDGRSLSSRASNYLPMQLFEKVGITMIDKEKTREWELMLFSIINPLSYDPNFNWVDLERQQKILGFWGNKVSGNNFISKRLISIFLNFLGRKNFVFKLIWLRLFLIQFLEINYYLASY